MKRPGTTLILWGREVPGLTIRCGGDLTGWLPETLLSSDRSNGRRPRHLYQPVREGGTGPFRPTTTNAENENCWRQEQRPGAGSDHVREE
jgi:hypothetical protein